MTNWKVGDHCGCMGEGDAIYTILEMVKVEVEVGSYTYHCYLAAFANGQVDAGWKGQNQLRRITIMEKLKDYVVHFE